MKHPCNLQERLGDVGNIISAETRSGLVASSGAWVVGHVLPSEEGNLVGPVNVLNNDEVAGVDNGLRGLVDALGINVDLVPVELQEILDGNGVDDLLESK